MRQVRQIRLGPEAKRDEGKVFVITEMSAFAAEKWIRDGVKALASAGLDTLPDEMDGAGLAVIAGYGFRALASAPTAEIDSLMDRLMGCVVHLPDPERPQITRGGAGQPLFESDVEEVSTLFRLKKEAFELVTGFTIGGASSASPPPPPATAPNP